MFQKIAFLLFACLLYSASANADQPTLPKISGPIAETPSSHAFLSSEHLNEPLDLIKYGYVEEEYLVSGDARVYDLPDVAGAPPRSLASGPYATRILIRRPKDDVKFNGTAIVEPLNPSTPVDLPIMWAEAHLQMMADGYAWVGVTIKPNTIKALKKFDPVRYAALAMPHPLGGPACNPADINSWAEPTTPADEMGLAWDILSEIGVLLKTKLADNPLTRPAERLYMTGQSQTANYSRTYATLFGRVEKGPKGVALYDGYFYSGSPPVQIPINQCWKNSKSNVDFFEHEKSPSSNGAQLTGPAGVPVIEILAQGDIGTNTGTERPDSDKAPDLFRRYEVAGAPHVDLWETKSFASDQDTLRAAGVPRPTANVDAAQCEPQNVTRSDFPTRYVFDAALRILDKWVRNDSTAPHASRLELQPGAAGDFQPDRAFVLDEYGNAKGGVPTPYIMVPTARWIGAMTPGLACMGKGYTVKFNKSALKKLYPAHQDYVSKIQKNVETLESQGWLTPTAGAAIIDEAAQSKIP